MKIACESVSKSFGPLRALDRISLEMEPGSIVALLGTNGAGKTTILRCLSGLLSLDYGMILYDGQVFRRERMELRRRLFFLPDAPDLFPTLSLARHLGLCLKLYGAEREDSVDRVVRLLKDFDLLPLFDAPVAILSRGQRYKAALVTLIAVDPELWLVDEPFASGIDCDGITAFKRHAQEAAARGRTILYSTQILDVAERFGHRVCVLHQGQVHAYDSVASLREHQLDGGGVLEGIFRALREESGGVGR